MLPAGGAETWATRRKALETQFVIGCKAAHADGVVLDANIVQPL